MSAAALSSLRHHIAFITNAKPDIPPGLVTGITALDAALGTRGVPRGRLTEIAGPGGSGKTTLLRRLVMETIAHGHAVAWVDAARTLAPRDWARTYGRSGAAAAARPHGPHGPHDTRNSRGRAGGMRGDQFWAIRPRDAGKGAWCADVLLRSGAFALVVLDGAPPLTRAVAARLTRLARDANAAFVVTSDSDAPATLLAAALRLRVVRAYARERARRHMTITVEKGGARTIVEVEYAISMAHRLCTHPEVPDRRGVARAERGTSERQREQRTQRQQHPAGTGTVGSAPGRPAGWHAAAHDLAGCGARGDPRGHDCARSPRVLCGAGDHSMG